MKKVFLFLSLALVCTIVMTSCGKEDEGTKDVALTGINVSPASVKTTVGNSITVTATPVPENATGVNFEWTPADPTKATVEKTADGKGKITIVALGTTTVTVSSGSVKKEITVEGVISINPLIRIDVNPTEIAKTVDDSVQVTASPYPPDADNLGDYVWKSDDTTVAVVNPEGWIYITGVGTTKVTVTNGEVKTEIPVTGSIKGITVVDLDGRTSYDEAIVNTTLQLKVVILPERLNDLDLIPDKWESNNDEVASVDQYTGLVTLKSKGVAIITATMPGGEQNYYTVGTGSILNEAYGYWRFDDTLNFGKATKGSDLEIIGDVHVVEGPSATNVAVEGTKRQRNFKWLHEKPAQPLNPEGTNNEYADVAGFTFMWDTRFYDIDRAYYSLYWNSEGNDASFFVRYMKSYKRKPLVPFESDVEYENEYEWTNTMVIGRGSYYPFYPLEPSDNTSLSPWMRLVVTYNIANENDGNYTVYVNGKVVEYTLDGNTKYLRGAGLGTNWRFMWLVNKPIYFEADGGGGTELDGGDGDDTAHPIAAIAVWDRALTEDEVSLLGGVK
jgi:hypothetical protein